MDHSPGVGMPRTSFCILSESLESMADSIAYEYAGTTFEEFSQEERMTVCNMFIEAERAPDTLSTRMTPRLPTSRAVPTLPRTTSGLRQSRALARFCFRSGRNLRRRRHFEAAEIGPTRTWGINPGQAIFIDVLVPSPEDCRREIGLPLRRLWLTCICRLATLSRGPRSMSPSWEAYQCPVERSDRSGASSEGTQGQKRRQGHRRAWLSRCFPDRRENGPC